jgi:hypothetical protein
VKRRKGLACCTALDQHSSPRRKPEGKIYNIFPYIEDPRHLDEGDAHAYTLLGIIDAIFYPVTHKDSVFRDEVDRLFGTVNHEGAHRSLGNTMVTCEERALAISLLAGIWHVLFDADGDVRLLIPSFTIVGPAGKVFELQRLAERLAKLYEAREAVHEIVARAIQVGSQGWDKGKATQLIRQAVGSNLLDRKTLESFLHVYEYLGSLELSAIGTCLLGQYALNEVGLTQQRALARFKRATEVASTFKSKDRQDTSPRIRLADYLSFMQHLDSNLPDFDMARCPQAEVCLPKRIERDFKTWVDSVTNRSREDGNPVPSLGEQSADAVYLNSTLCMRKSRCDREEQFAQGNNMVPDSLIELLWWYDHEALSILGNEREKPTRQSIRFLMLIDHDNCDCKYTVGVTSEEKGLPLVEFAPETFSIVVLEASLQQMMYGEGPLCLCYPHQPVNCSYRPLLQRLWDYTESESDLEWENTWKLPQKKPPCIT